MSDGEPAAGGRMSLLAGGRGRMLAGATVVNLALGSLYAWSLFVDPLRDAFGSPPSAVAGVFSVAVGVFAAIVLVGAAAVDRTAPRRVVAVVTLIGMSYGVQSALVPAATADLFGTVDFAANFGRVFTGWGIAGLVGPQIGARLGDVTQGFAAALRLGAASAACAFLLYGLLARLLRHAARVPRT